MYSQMNTHTKTNLLFICSRNQWRSPTAELIWRNHPDFNVRSAGTSPNARTTVNANLIKWADAIFVMEKKHRNRLLAAFPAPLKYKPLFVLDIPDDYQFNDPELIEELKTRVEPLLES